MKIFIRADGGNKIGLGHIMRMIVLATELKKNNEVIFLCRTSYKEFDKFEAGINKIKENGFELIKISENNVIKDIIKLQREYKADLLITDSYEVDEKYFDVLKPYFKITGYVDDINIHKMNVDFIINQNINAEELNYYTNVNDYTKLLLGTRYCMLRKEFRDLCTQKEIRQEVNDILVTLGGMDKDYNTLKILNAIKKCNKNIHVVIGNAFNKELIEEIYKICLKYPQIKAYENANMSKLMIDCDIAISGCGSTLYELCSMSVPTIGIIIADNQKNIAKKMQQDMLILKSFYPDDINEKNIMQMVIKLINNNKIRFNIMSNQKKAINLNGVEKIVEEINSYNT